MNEIRLLTHCPLCGANLISPGLRIDTKRAIIQKDDVAVQVTPQQAAIMEMLHKSPKATENLLCVLGGYDATTDERTLRTQITHLRHAIKPLKLDIKNIWGWGYELREME